MKDFNLTHYGSISMLTPLTPAGEAWAVEHLPADATRWGYNSIVIEPRYVEDIVIGIQGDGLDI